MVFVFEEDVIQILNRMAYPVYPKILDACFIPEYSALVFKASTLPKVATDFDQLMRNVILLRSMLLDYCVGPDQPNVASEPLHIVGDECYIDPFFILKNGFSKSLDTKITEKISEVMKNKELKESTLSKVAVCPFEEFITYHNMNSLSVSQSITIFIALASYTRGKVCPLLNFLFSSLFKTSRIGETGKVFATCSRMMRN